MNFALSILSSLYQQTILFICCLFLLQLPRSKWLCRRTLLPFFVSWIPMVLIQQFNNHWVLLSLFLMLTIFTITLHIITGRRYLYSLLSICVSYLLMLFSNLPILFVWYFFWSPEYILQAAWLSLITAILGSVFQLAALRYLPVRQFYKSLCKIPASVSYFILLFLAILALLCSLSTELTYVPEFIKIFLIVLLGLNSSLILTHQILINRRNSMELHYYEQYLPILDNLIEKVRETQHGHNNTIQAILHLIDVDSSNEQISRELADYTKEFQKTLLPSALLRLDNKLLAALLYQKYCLASEQGKSLHFSIADPTCHCPATEFEVVDAVGILVDNALEASTPGDRIYISIHRRHDKDGIKIVVDNPGQTVNDDFRERILKKGYTTKTKEPDKHGLGLSILQNMVNKYSGALLISNKNHDEIQHISFELLL